MAAGELVGAGFQDLVVQEDARGAQKQLDGVIRPLSGEGALAHPLGDDIGEDRGQMLDHGRDGQQVKLRVSGRVELLDELGLGALDPHRGHDRLELVHCRSR